MTDYATKEQAAAHNEHDVIVGLIDAGLDKLERQHADDRKWKVPDTPEFFKDYAPRKVLLDELCTARLLRFTHGDTDEAIRMIRRRLSAKGYHNLDAVRGLDKDGHRAIMLM